MHVLDGNVRRFVCATPIAGYAWGECEPATLAYPGLCAIAYGFAEVINSPVSNLIFNEFAVSSYMEQSQNILNLIIFVEFVYELATLTLSVFTISFVRI